MEEKPSNEEKTDLATEFKRLLESGTPLEERQQKELLNKMLEINH